MKIEMQTKIIETGYVIREQYDIAKNVNPQEYATGLISQFNATLRSNESPRELMSVTVLQEESEVVCEHDWEKQNLVTVVKGGKLYDVMVCKICGVTGKRFGFGGVTRDSKYKSQKYENCNWYLNA